MIGITEKEAVELLRKYSNNKESFSKVLNHSRAVQKLALEIANDIRKNHDVDIDFIKTASLLHDIGRFKCYKENSIRHGIVGGEILSKEGLRKYARIAETHIGIGITKQDIKKYRLDLPLKDFIPETIEEKIISYADNFIFDTKRIKISKVIERFSKELGEKHIERVKKLHNEIEKLRGKNNFL
ncbi:MAG: HDIG domain-containing protein [Nanoarchaeota archaeon]|nr:HDIG domain-containing protein [Nanoarchaeota archaeon]MBU4493082.1 HDIG domain-containing protein [Nanoarchaeota archaeon]